MASEAIQKAARRLEQTDSSLFGSPIYSVHYETLAEVALGAVADDLSERRRTNELLADILEALDRLDPNRR